MKGKIRILLTVTAILFIGPWPVHADLDWGGGITQFQTDAGTPLTSENGLAILVSVHAGGLIDFASYLPPEFEDLFTPGSILAQGQNTNIVLAGSDAFVDGYLLVTTVPILSNETQISFGVQPNENLYLVVWDRNTFSGERPLLGSRFTVLQLFKNGDPMVPATTYGPQLPNSADMIYPDKDLAVARCETGTIWAVPGDIDGTLEVDLRDAILALQIACRYVPAVPIRKESDVNGDGRIGMEEAVYALQWISRSAAHE